MRICLSLIYVVENGKEMSSYCLPRILPQSLRSMAHMECLPNTKNRLLRCSSMVAFLSGRQDLHMRMSTEQYLLGNSIILLRAFSKPLKSFFFLTLFLFFTIYILEMSCGM